MPRNHRRFAILKENVAWNFLGLASDLSDYSKSKFVILPAGYDSTTSYLSGTREGPFAIIKASTLLEKYDPELQKDTSLSGIATLPPLMPDMQGPEAMVKRIQEKIEGILEDEKFAILLGGEHSLSIGAIQAYQKIHPGLGILQIDAHLDLRESYDETPFSHACAMRRVADQSRVISTGIRCAEPEETEFLEQSNSKTFFSWELWKKPAWQESLLLSLPEKVYISIDLDGFDPCIMPSVGTPEPGGLLWEEINTLFKLVAKKHRIVGFDVVELCPIPGFLAPDYLAAKMVYRLMGLCS